MPPHPCPLLLSGGEGDGGTVIINARNWFRKILNITSFAKLTPLLILSFERFFHYRYPHARTWKFKPLMTDDVSPSSSEQPPATPHRRRPRYAGRNPRGFEEKYKEHNPQRYSATVAKVLASGKTPAGS